MFPSTKENPLPNPRAFLTALSLFLTACGSSTPPAPAAAPPRPVAVPAEGVLTLPTPADIAAAVASAKDPAIQKAVNDYLAKPALVWTVTAARPVGDYVLLWISFPKIVDGGIDLIYSTKDQRVYWTFLGGIRG